MGLNPTSLASSACLRCSCRPPAGLRCHSLEPKCPRIRCCPVRPQLISLKTQGPAERLGVLEEGDLERPPSPHIRRSSTSTSPLGGSPQILKPVPWSFPIRLAGSGSASGDIRTGNPPGIAMHRDVNARRAVRGGSAWFRTSWGVQWADGPFVRFSTGRRI